MDSETARAVASPAAPQTLYRLVAALRPLRTLLTRSGVALAFDALVFVVLALLAASLLAGGALADEALYMLCGLVGFAVFWGSISGGDVARFAKLQRRWLRHVRTLPQQPVAPALVLRAPERKPAPPLRPLVAQSAVRPASRAGSVHSLSLWRSRAPR